MSHDMLYKGHDIDIEKTFSSITLFGFDNGREQKISLESLSDMEVLYSVLGDILNGEYAKMQIQAPIDYDIEGC